MQILDYSEKWGKDVEEAVKLALIDLKCERDQVKVTVLEEPSRGFLGFGAKLAKVRVELINPQTKVVEDEKRPKPVERIKKEENIKPMSEKAAVNNIKKSDDIKTTKDDSSTLRAKPVKSFNGKENNNFDKSKKSESFSTGLSTEIDLTDATPVTEGPAVDFLNMIISKMDLKLNLSACQKDNVIYISIEGKDSGTIIGKRGQALDAIQYLTSLVVNKQNEKYTRVIINAENYRQKREKTLEKLALRLADKVIASGKSVRLEPMNPYERKVIHSTLQRSDKVTTRSEGEEPYRRVIIEMKK